MSCRELPLPSHEADISLVLLAGAVLREQHGPKLRITGHVDRVCAVACPHLVGGKNGAHGVAGSAHDRGIARIEGQLEAKHASVNADETTVAEIKTQEVGVGKPAGRP